MDGSTFTNGISRTLIGVVALLVFVTAPQLTAQTTRPAKNDLKIGVVTGNNVNVRSGFTTAYYPVTKLSRGDRVQIVGEESGWYKIVPPKGCFSLVEKTYVDESADGDTGILNGQTWIRCGSSLSNLRYTNQIKLDKGTKVRILGKSEDGAFYKIAPPPGAVVWIISDFVETKPGAVAGSDVRETRAESPRAETIEAVQPGELDLTGETISNETAGTDSTRRADTSDLPKNTDHVIMVPADSTTLSKDSPTTTSPSGATSGTAAESKDQRKDLMGLSVSEKYEIQLNAIEAEITAEHNRAFEMRDYGPIIAKLQPIADQTEDKFASLYAQARIEQMSYYNNRVAALRDLMKAQRRTTATSSSLREERERIKEMLDTQRELKNIAVKGEIRVSNVFDGGGARGKLWRVVDPKTETTLAYIDLAPGSSIKPADYYNKYVGIKASARRTMKNTTPPLSIYTVEKIIVQGDDDSDAAPHTGARSSTTRPARAN